MKKQIDLINNTARQRFQAGIYAQYYNDKGEDIEILLWFDNFNIDNKSNEIGFAHDDLLRAIPDNLTEHEENTLLDWFEANYGTAYEEWYNGRADIIRQYSGLNDIDNRPIFDGDILNVKIQDYVQKKHYNPYWTIEYKNFGNRTGFMAYGINRRWNALLTHNIIFSANAKVIGNIYDNQDLIRKTPDGKCNDNL